MSSDSEHSPLRSIIFFIILLTLSGSLLTACKKVKPKPPAAEGFDDSLTVSESYVSAPLVFELSALEGKINKALPKVLVDSDQQQTGISQRWHLRIERTGPIRLAYNGKRVSFGTSLKVWLSNSLSLKKRAARRRQAFCSLNVRFYSPLNVNNGWRLQTNVQLDQYTWIQKPALHLLGIKIPVAKVADYILQKREDGIEEAINDAVRNELRLDLEVAKIWRDIQKPLLINRQYEKVWLCPHPYGVLTAPIYGNAQRIVIPVRIKLHVSSAFGPEPVYPIARLPRLVKVDSLPMTCALNLLSRIPYQQLNQLLARHMTNKKMGVMTVKKTTVYGGQHAVIVRADIKGTINGTLYFTGRPSFDSLKHTLAVQQFSYDMHTEESLTRTADWVLHDRLKDTLQATLKVPLQQQLALIPTKIEQAFARGNAGKHARIDVKNFRLVSRGIAIRPEAIDILLHADAAMILQVTDL